MAAFVESARAGAGADEVIQLVSDGVNEYSEKMMEGVVACPRILMPCKVNDDCLRGCKCLSNGYCG
uniref:Trypsin inhibitor 1 n=1 Tax=Trichosanthes kirilowii TaxID=3677 RepID=ITR1_TRIKI|nr:RecName: Full=Trypsin inhibitor 1; AltName: Full=TTII; AltName: Full=Trypsin inhibitor I; Flags: Precursor [Trichosanthes kirilowii]CAA57704.1 Trichosanthes trypsin inhibitor-I [Trichosanthes kirilowii]